MLNFQGYRWKLELREVRCILDRENIGLLDFQYCPYGG